MRDKKIVVGLALAVLAAPAWSASWSGSYVGSGVGVSFYVQLVESPGGAIVGRFKQVSVDKENKLKTIDEPMSGASSGDQFVGKIEAGWARGGNIVISGKRIPGGIQITGASGLRANLRPGTEEDEARAMAVLRQGVQKTIAAGELQKNGEQKERNLKKRVESLQGILNGASSYVENGSLTYRNYAAYPERYKATTAKLESTLEKLKATPGRSGDAISRRTDLGVSMFHAKIDNTEHPQIDVGHAYEASMRKWKELEAKFNAAVKACAEIAPAGLDISSFKALCVRVPQASESLSRAGESSRAEFEKIRVTHQRELARQEGLLSEAREVDRSFGGR